ncbi:MAG: hypothetical protein LKH76_09415 [Acetobacter fabarum]|uniref:hypothetical protein n=1 Tax=Acetobacter TaxID=434 RepID=UPI00209D38F3|nr:hypothetical protein [Acetobacter fabarum]MCH4025255.1 hypothetical protein [Acetobacter fabarum]MCH4055097.1 hypothetical protein [Acetobacter fabarum]MCH4128763.1 hypothetical protein [Acetobacter fabarum]MCH4141996.1 hypothetical protein [Acetobacter fabarum]MCI1323347.1 hypothetical protein [Acetobacter fabarum]
MTTSISSPPLWRQKRTDDALAGSVCQPAGNGIAWKDDGQIVGGRHAATIS